MVDILTPYQQATHGIVVTVMPTYLAHQSKPEDHHFIWNYHIRIRNTNDYSVQLLERHWIIYDAKGLKDDIRGDGVFGEQPVIKPHSHFDYQSSVPLKTPSGIMQGRYRFITTDDTKFWVDIPAFSLDSPHDKTHKH